MGKNKEKILVVCHDAGGSEVISAYVRKNARKKRFFCLVSGPGIKVFKRKGLKKFLIPNNKTPKGFLRSLKPDLVLAGFSASMGQLPFIRAAKAEKTKSAIYIDHWTDYRRGIGYPEENWRENMPDEFWAGDADGLRIAKKLFPGRKIKFVKNLYFIERKKEYNQIRKKLKKPEKTLVFMSEPYTAVTSFSGEPFYGLNEYRVLDKLLAYLSAKKFRNKVVICNHPSEARSKFDALISRYAGKLKISKQSDSVLKDIANAQVVVGMMGMILAISVICGKKTVSFIPHKGINCMLPDKRIIRIHDVRKLGEIIKL
ncbi:MAG: hypothetical protein PHP03_03055 [Candidatus Pacebacteria bacterium]|nr:hypothetical protein [Candidatus Paceibacterota bacterium]